MALIRQSNAATMARDAIVLDLGDLRAQGELIKARARAEAEQILADAKTERAGLLKLATEEGRAEGLAKGLEEGRKAGREEGRKAAFAEHADRLAKLEQGWTAALDTFNSARDSVQLEARQDVLKLAVMMGEMVTRRALAIDPSSVSEQLAAVLGLVAKSTRGTLIAHPDDLPLLQDCLPGTLHRLGTGAHLELIPDASIERGGCFLRTPAGGEIDATIRTQLERIVETLLPAPPEPAP